MTRSSAGSRPASITTAKELVTLQPLDQGWELFIELSRLGPGGEEAAVIDLFERAEVFLPFERAGGEPKPTRVGDAGQLGAGRGVGRVGVRETGAELSGRGDRVGSGGKHAR